MERRIPVSAEERAASPVMDRLWTYEDLGARWSVGPRQVRRIAQNLGLKPVAGMGAKTVRFRPCSVLAAEERAEAGRKRRGFLD